MAKVTVAFGQYHCTSCGNALRFETGKTVHDSLRDGSPVIAVCDSYLSRCTMYGVRLKVPLQQIECEVIDE